MKKKLLIGALALALTAAAVCPAAAYAAALPKTEEVQTAVAAAFSVRARRVAKSRRCSVA